MEGILRHHTVVIPARVSIPDIYPIHSTSREKALPIIFVWVFRFLCLLSVFFDGTIRLKVQSPHSGRRGNCTSAVRVPLSASVGYSPQGRAAVQGLKFKVLGLAQPMQLCALRVVSSAVRMVMMNCTICRIVSRFISGKLSIIN